MISKGNHVKFARFVPAVSEEAKTSFFFSFLFDVLEKERKFGRARRECFHSFFEFSHTFMSVCITR